MNIDWTTLLVSLFGTGGIVSVAQNIRFRKENKKLKSVEAQSAQIDLGEKYYQKVIEMTENSTTQQTRILSKLDNVSESISVVVARQAKMEEYLDGPYHAWLAENESKQHENN